MSLRVRAACPTLSTVLFAGTLVGAAIAMPTSSLAQGSGEYTPPPVGLEITWKRTDTAGGKTATGTFRHKVLSAKGDVAVYKVGSTDKYDGDEVRLLRGIFSYAYWRPGDGWVEYRFDRKAIAALWPLKAGNKARVKMRFGYGIGKTLKAAKAKWKFTETGEITYRVLGRATVTVPAGTFETFVIARTRWFRKVGTGEYFIQRRTGWLAPKLGYIVKQTLWSGSVGEPNVKTSVFVATSIKGAGGR